ncbi:MAG: hypothetical protein M1840_005922 [Geoglossum simile]|nr:MAG: hypothetical protein M1840_005922 [Geoglossum simile]
MALQPIFKKAYWALVAGGGLYFACLLILTNTWVQRHALYAHKLHTAYFRDLNKPEQFGFAKNQTSPFSVRTPDGEKLYAWHILPLAVYAKNEQLLVGQAPGYTEDYTATESFKLLVNDPESRLVIYFHGNAGHIGQPRRTDAYRIISSGAPDKIHIIAFDYRGFGYSTGSPTEEGVITDAVAMVDWALTVAGLPPERILLLGQSLGTAVATAAAEHFSKTTPQVDFAGLILVAGFSDLPTLMLTYSIGGYLPLLSPLRPYPVVQKWFAGQMTDKWNTAVRLASYVRRSQKVNLFLIHSRNDRSISWTHSDVLFYVAASATSQEGLTVGQINPMKAKFNLGEGGLVNTWHIPNKAIRQEIVKYGAHNRIVTYAPIALIVLRAFGIQGCQASGTLNEHTS